MQIVHTINDARAALAARGRPRVLVPTMGALHAGHVSLVEEARRIAGDKGSVAVTIFVNPTQFAPGEDLDSYPRTLEADAAKCEVAGADLIIAPPVEEVYFEDRSITIHESALSLPLCGASRPGHFDGVCTVVAKLFNIAQPDTAVFGQKDYQQLAVIRRMVRDLNVPVEIVAAPTVREEDGLAMSSRNTYLSKEERAEASAIRRGLLHADELFRAGETSSAVLLAAFSELIARDAPIGKIDYAELVDAETLESLENTGELAVMAVAVFFGKTRLIDNIVLGDA